MSADSVGYYGIFTASIGYAIFFVGAEFHVYVARQILSVPEESRGRMLKGHAALSGVLYLVWFPLFAALLYQAGWPEHLVLWFLPILFLDHINQEIFRVMVVMRAQLSASFLLFIRQGTWAIAMVLLMAFSEAGRSLDIIMMSWLFAGVAALALGVQKLRRLEITGWHLPIDWAWMRRGLLIAAPFLIATLAQRGILTFDRYWLKDLGGIEIVGSYVLFFGVASGLSVFLDAGVFSYTYPELIKHHLDNEREIARAKVRVMLWQTLVSVAGFAVVSWLLMPYILQWIGNPVHEGYIGLFPWVLSAISLLAISQVAHWGLYAIAKDKVIVISHIVALIGFVMVTWMGSDNFGPLAVLIGLNAAFGSILIIKGVAYFRLTRPAGARV
ncbi:MAG: hypothetical protein COB08_012090 [Rhodobacteraceae bacterium]|nr:hypothetical protein [Paracoccaceae bacterium]